jgi:hypothetical protein
MTRPLPISRFWYRPGPARIDGTEIVFAEVDVGELVRLKRSGPAALYPHPKKSTLLQEFLLLANGTDDRLCEFASRYGPLYSLLKPLGGERESLELWRQWSKWAAAILRIKKKLGQNKRVEKEEWESLGNINMVDFPWMPEKSQRSIRRDGFAHIVNAILFLWEVQPGIRWRSGDRAPRFELHCSRTISVIGAELIFELSKLDSCVVCSDCGNIYLPKRKPREDQNHFCDDCSKKSSWKLAQRKRRQESRSRIERGQ